MAYSAGADSTALVAGRSRTLARVRGGRLACAPWSCRRRPMTLRPRARIAVCEQLGIFHSHLLRMSTLLHAPGQSPEDAARIKRYRRPGRSERRSDRCVTCVLLGPACRRSGRDADARAQPRRRACRGWRRWPSGLSGTAWCLARPLAGVAVANTAATGLGRNERPVPFVDDPTNTDPRYTRNRIRARRCCRPGTTCFPGFRPMLARSARHAAQAQHPAGRSGAHGPGCRPATPPTITGAAGAEPGAPGQCVAPLVAQQRRDVVPHSEVQT